MLYPVELQAQSLACAVGRGRGIRTLDIQLPKLALYQAELYPVSPDFGHPWQSQRSGDVTDGRQHRQLPGNRTSPCNKPHATETPSNKRVPQHPHINGAPGRIRTSDHQVRSLVLYPADLRARKPCLPCIIRRIPCVASPLGLHRDEKRNYSDPRLPRQ
jgi:hypothetical protein